MNELGLVYGHYLALGAAIFLVGVLGFLLRRNVLLQLMSIELMLNAANLVLVAYNRWHTSALDGQVLVFFVIAVAAAEAAVGLGIVVSFFRLRSTVHSDEADTLRH
jgi:NADH-quinone oxidoreductase subunit K